MSLATLVYEDALQEKDKGRKARMLRAAKNLILHYEKKSTTIRLEDVAKFEKVDALLRE